MGFRRSEFWLGTASVLALAFAPGCGGEEDESMMSGPAFTAGGATDPVGDDDDDDDDSAEGPGDDDDDDDDDSAGSCDLDMEIAVRVTVDVSWPGGIAVLEGQGAINAWLIGMLEPDGTDVHLTGQMCRLELPDFETGLLAGGETYGTLFPDAIWTHPNMPVVDAWATISSADPGGTLVLPEGAVVLGANLNDPLLDPWPADWSALATVDHDGDGSPGITAVAKTGGGYAYPRIDILNSDARAEALFLASRTVMEFDGTIDSCDSASGNASMAMENHNVGCRVLGGGECSAGQTGTLDNNLPIFSVLGGSFDLVRLSDGAGCQDVFAALP